MFRTVHLLKIAENVATLFFLQLTFAPILHKSFWQKSCPWRRARPHLSQFLKCPKDVIFRRYIGCRCCTRQTITHACFALLSAPPSPPGFFLDRCQPVGSTPHHFRPESIVVHDRQWPPASTGGRFGPEGGTAVTADLPKGRVADTAGGVSTPDPSPRQPTSNGVGLNRLLDARTPDSTKSGRLRGAHTPGGAGPKRSARDVGAPSRGTGSRRSGRKRRRFGTPGTHAQQQTVGTRAERQMQRDVFMKMAAAEYDEQQTTARAEAQVRRKRAAADDDVEARRGSSVRGSGRDRSRRSLGGGSVRSPEKPPAEVRRRKRACGLDECGWVTPAPGAVCSRCPSQLVHASGEKLCTACRRPTSDSEFTHLRSGKRRKEARHLIESWRSEGGWRTGCSKIC